jgi:hypothetical protein
LIVLADWCAWLLHQVIVALMEEWRQIVLENGRYCSPFLIYVGGTRCGEWRLSVGGVVQMFAIPVCEALKIQL